MGGTGESHPPPRHGLPTVSTALSRKVISFNDSRSTRDSRHALAYAANTDGDLFVHSPTRQYYYLAAGRWFRAGSLQGPWTYATPDLPADFAVIPQSSPASRVLASVPGTEEAKDAVLLAQIPNTVNVNPTTAAAQGEVSVRVIASQKSMANVGCGVVAV